MSAVLTQEIWVDTNQGRIFAKRWSQETSTPRGNAPIVLFHDSLGCVELWRDFPERLARTTARSVIAYDRMGFGKSDPHPGALDGSFVREEAHGAFSALRKQLEINSFVAFGHSVGGGMAVACAATYARDCRALITESAQAFVEERTIEGILDAKRAFEREGRLDRLKKHHGDKARWVLHAWIDTWLAPDFASWNLDEDLRRVQCPVLAIHGDNDEYGSIRHPERIGELTVGHSVIEILPECGHVPHREKESVVVEMVKGWLDSIAG
jgi:pimeloyl-ACP methyl ester carboxylesterase